MEQFDPDAPALAKKRRPLGSLVHSARQLQIYRAQRTLILVGVLMMSVGSYLRQNIPREIVDAVREQNIAPAEQPQFQRERTLKLALLYGGLVTVGVGLATMGLFVTWFPVPFTVAGMVLYGIALLGYTLVHPGWILHEVPAVLSLVVFVPLALALKAGLAYEREKRRASNSGVLSE